MSVFIVEILRGKSETIMSKTEKYVLMSFCLKICCFLACRLLAPCLQVGFTILEVWNK